MREKYTFGKLLLDTLSHCGVDHIFGVPGSYNLRLLNQMHGSQVSWVGTCNELSAAYAADGYARVNGIAALLTTYGVGELSAINGIAGAYAEHVPVINIVVMPTKAAQTGEKLLHHSLSRNTHLSFFKMYEFITEDQLLITPETENIPEKLNQIILTCWQKKRPVYIGIFGELIEKEIQKPEATLQFFYPPTNKNTLTSVLDSIGPFIQKAQSPVILVDVDVARYSMQDLILEFVEKTKIPFVTTAMAKGVLNESHLQYLGFYGYLDENAANERVERSDCVIAFGDLIDTEMGVLRTINYKTILNIQMDKVFLQEHPLGAVYFNDLMPALIGFLTTQGYACPDRPVSSPPLANETLPTSQQDALTQDVFWPVIETFLKPHDLIISDVGSCSAGILDVRFPDHTRFICQLMWAALGYSLGATLGGQLARSENKRTVLFLGDGAFHMTEQTLGTLLQYNLTPIIFLLNNRFYTIEEALYESKGTYNQPSSRQFTYIKEYFDGKNMNFFSVKTKDELLQALETVNHSTDKLNFVEVNLPKDDVPRRLAGLISCIQAKASASSG